MEQAARVWAMDGEEAVGRGYRHDEETPGAQTYPLRNYINVFGHRRPDAEPEALDSFDPALDYMDRALGSLEPVSEEEEEEEAYGGWPVSEEEEADAYGGGPVSEEEEEEEEAYRGGQVSNKVRLLL
jgi:hypothetical protein